MYYNVCTTKNRFIEILKMLNRRHLRIKVLQSLYAYFQSGNESAAKAEKELMTAVERIYDLYIYLLLTFGELKTVAERRMEESKKKIRPSDEETNPNLKFISNQVIAQLVSSFELRAVSEDKKVNWLGVEEQEVIRKMFLEMRESETYFSHMNNEVVGFEEDIQFSIALFKAEIANSEILYHYFEEKSIHWLDDIDLACSMVVKTLKSAVEGEKIEILPLYKDKDDEIEFIQTLLRKTIEFDTENLVLIDDLTKNWEIDRIAKMDILLLKMAITEIQVCKNIPIKVTMNEYIEISKFYSTPKSHGFINGILDNAIEQLKKDNKIGKIGRGLVN